MSLAGLAKLGGKVAGWGSAGLFAGAVAAPLVQGVRRRARSKERTAEALLAEERAWLRDKSEVLRRNRLQRDMAENAARLAALAPDVYNRVLAGRMLPKGATVLGGSPRTDLLEQLTSGMAQGAYKPPPADDSELLAELAG